MKTLSEFTKLSLKELADEVDRYLCEVFPAVEEDQLDDLNGVGGILKLCNALVESIDSYLNPDEKTEIQFSPTEYIGKTMYSAYASGIEKAVIRSVCILEEAIYLYEYDEECFFGNTDNVFFSLSEAQAHWWKMYKSEHTCMTDLEESLKLDVDFKSKGFDKNTATYQFDFAGKEIEFEVDENENCFFGMSKEARNQIIWNAIKAYF